MASNASTVRSLQPDEVGLVCSALELQAKSCERAARAASNSVISSEYSKQASICRNLVAHFRNGSLAV